MTVGMYFYKRVNSRLTESVDKNKKLKLATAQCRIDSKHRLHEGVK